MLYEVITLNNPSTKIYTAGQRDTFYIIKFTVSNSCGSSTHTDTVVVGTTAHAEFTMPHEWECSPVTVKFRNLTSGIPISYNRITSYNVCYTKLLRVSNGKASFSFVEPENWIRWKINILDFWHRPLFSLCFRLNRKVKLKNHLKIKAVMYTLPVAGSLLVQTLAAPALSKVNIV